MGSDGYFRGLSGIRPRPARAVPVLHNERQARLQRVFGEGRGRASCASAGVWGGQGPSIMRISGCLGSFKSGPIQVQQIKFRWTCEKQSIMRISCGWAGWFSAHTRHCPLLLLAAPPGFSGTSAGAGRAGFQPKRETLSFGLKSTSHPSLFLSIRLSPICAPTMQQEHL